MDPNDRIEELESQVRELNDLVHHLIGDAPQSGEAQKHKSKELLEGRLANMAAASKSMMDPTLVQDVRERVDKAIRGNSDETIETRIGSLWLSRMAVLAVMTTAVLAARTTFSSALIGPAEKVLLGYCAACAFVVYGLYFRNAGKIFSQAILGCGLAGLYFNTYALFYIEQMRIGALGALLPAGWPSTLLAMSLLLLSLVFMALVAHRLRSQTVAGIGLFLAYYTVVLSCTHTPSVETMTHALLTCTILAICTLFFHIAHQWMFFSWVALISTHLTYLYFFVYMNTFGHIGIPEKSYFWISNGFLTLCFILFSLTCIMDARKRGEYRRMVAPMAGVNSAVFLCLTYFAIREHYPQDQWIFRLAVAALMLFFAICAETTGPRRNYLFQIFIAKTVIMLTLALQSALAGNGEILLVAMAIECLGLAFSYKRSSIVIFKILGLGLMGITFVGCLAAMKMPGNISLIHYTIPANWFSACGVTFVFCIIAWFYEKFVRRLHPEKRTLSGHWFMAESLFDLHHTHMAMLHAACGALILLSITIIERGESLALPFYLAGEGALLAALGVFLLTAQIEVASVLLLVASHVCFHVFLWLPMPGFENQEHYVVFTLFLGLLTYVGAHAWERYLRRFQYDGYELEHHLVAALPYFAATFILSTLIARQLIPLHVPPAQAALGMTLLLIGSLSGYSGVKASGILAVALGAISFYQGLYTFQAPFAKEPFFILYFSLFMLSLVGAERLIALLQEKEKKPSRIEDLIRSLLVILLVVFGVLGLYEWSPPRFFVVYVLGHAVLIITFGALFFESRYRWGALFLFAFVLVRAFMYFKHLSPLYQILTFGAFSVVLLVVSWAYSHSRKQSPQKERNSEKKESAS